MIRNLEPVSPIEDPVGLSEMEKELKDLKDQFHNQYHVGPLIKKCCTVDQAKAVIAFLDSILDKTLRSTVALTASRGHGKSAALGLAVVGAVATGYSNIFATTPSPENLKILFEFIIKGFESIEYKEHSHYDLMRGTDQESKKAIIRINVFKEHRQTIQYLRPSDHAEAPYSVAR